MPYILSPLITEKCEGMWLEGKAYSKESIFSIVPGEVPPVNYDKHIIKSHSLAHIEAPKHVLKNGRSVDDYFETDYYFGMCKVLRLKGDNYKDVGGGVYHWEVSLEELRWALNDVVPKKLLITSDKYRKNISGFHDPNYVLTLSQEAADWLINDKKFNLFGTSWKSSDFSPGSLERPIHKTIFSKAIIAECLDLEKVPEGDYFLVAYPLRIKDSSESPVTPVLFTLDEIKDIF